MGRVHFSTFFSIVKKAYKGNENAAKKAIHTELKNAKLIGASFYDFIDAVQSYAMKSADDESRAIKWRDSDENLEASFAAGKGDALKASAIHFYLLSHENYANWAKALNAAINLPELMDEEFKDAVFGFGAPLKSDEAKRVHPIPSCPSGPFHWPLYVSEEDACSPDPQMEGVWLNPLNHYSIPLSHRREEISLLDAFVQDERRFLICALVAPSGAGKTRLVSEWMRKFVPDVSDTDWDAGFVTDRKSEAWESWDISRNTVIVIDYTYAFDDVMRGIVERCRYHNDKKEKKVRLLVIDHVYPQVLQSDFFWSRPFIHQGHVDSRKSAILFNRSPIELRAEQTGSLFLREVIAASASSHAQRCRPDDLKVVMAEAILSEMGKTSHGGNPEAVRHPLFAALLGQAMREGQADYTNWTRRDLITHYFAKPFRLPWFQDAGDSQDTGIWIGAYVAIATLFRGVPFKVICSHLPKSLHKTRSAISRINFIEESSKRFVSSSDSHILKPLEPDILGENFLIQFFKAIDGDDDIVLIFINMMIDCIGVDKDGGLIFNLLEVMQRLARNLLNDNQQIESVIEAWEIVDAFLSPNRFPSGSVIRQLISIIRADFIKQCRSVGAYNRAAQFAEKIEFVEIQKASSGRLWRQAATASMHFFDWQFRKGNASPEETHILVSVAKIFREHTANKWPALMFAATEDCVEAAKAIHREMKEGINAKQFEGWTVLMAAAHFGRKNSTRWLLENGAEVNLGANDSGWTALMAACANGYTDVVRLLLKNGALVNQARTTDGRTALMAACSNGHVEITRLLIENKAEVNQGKTDNGWTALMAACQKGHTDVARLLLENDADVNQRKIDDGWTALMLACHEGHTNTVQLLLEKRPQVNSQGISANGWTPLILTCQTGHIDIVRLLLKNGAEINQAATDDGWTALMAACMNGHINIADLLLKNDANVNQGKIDDGWTALMATCATGYTALARLLLENNAEVNQGTQDNGRTALMVACQEGHNDVVRLLLENKAEPNQGTTDGGLTALMGACACGHIDTVQLLLTNGAEVNQLDAVEHSALDYAIQENYSDICAFLCRVGGKTGAKIASERGV